MALDLLAVIVIVAITLIVYYFTENRANLAIASLIYVYLGLVIFSEGLVCNPSFLCTSQTTILSKADVLALLVFVVLVFGAIINIISAFADNGRLASGNA